MGGEAENSSAGHFLTPFLGKWDKGLEEWRGVQRRRQLMVKKFVSQPYIQVWEDTFSSIKWCVRLQQAHLYGPDAVIWPVQSEVYPQAP